MATINVGKIRPTYQGAYDATKDYAFLDWVTHEGSSYICITLQGAPAGTAITDETCWICLAKKGADGITPTFEIGTVTTGAAGASAKVEITGTAPNYVLNFTIPKGADGKDGTDITWAASSGGASAANPAVVVSTYRSGDTWYRIYSDGFKEMGGKFYAQTATVTYPVAFTTIVLSIKLTTCIAYDGAAEKHTALVYGATTPPSLTYFKGMWSSYWIANSYCCWYACGY